MPRLLNCCGEHRTGPARAPGCPVVSTGPRLSERNARALGYTLWAPHTSAVMIPTLLSPNFKLEEVTRDDMIIASLAWGFSLGFGWLTTWTAIKQTISIWKRYGTRSIHNVYVWLIWLEILVCLIFSVICWLYLRGVILPRRATLPSTCRWSYMDPCY